jgi:hypothetical protein
MRTLLTGALVGIFAIAAFAADVTGKWTAEVPGRGGNMQTNTFMLKQDGAKLTGTVDGGRGGPSEISDGKVDGDNISFVRTVTFGDNTIKMVYKGKVAGNEIKFTRTMEGGQGGGAPPTEFTAKKAN